MFARRIVVELRSSPDLAPTVSDDLLDLWSGTIDEWSAAADHCRRTGRPFRWMSEVDPEQAEFLLAGLDRSLHSPELRRLCTDEEVAQQLPFTVLVLRSFIDGLASESDCCRQYADHVSVSLQGLLPD